MSPRDLNADILTARLSLMTELLEDLESLGAVNEQRLREERITLRALERILTQLVDLAVDVNGHIAATVLGKAPEDYRGSFRLANDAGAIDGDLARRLQESVGLRNVLVHEYVRTDLVLVASSRSSALADYRAYVQQVSDWLRDRG